MRAEISWTRRDEEGRKFKIAARRFGREWQFSRQSRRNEDWEPISEALLEDWLELLDAVRRRVPRRLFPPEEVARIQAAIRTRFPEASDLEALRPWQRES